MSSGMIEIKFRAFDYRILDSEVSRVLSAVKKTGSKVCGPIPMPIKIERFTVNRSPHVDKKSREQFEIRTYERILRMTSTEQVVDALKKLDLRSGVEIQIKILNEGKYNESEYM